jgi:hypothetical protein
LLQRVDGEAECGEGGVGGAFAAPDKRFGPGNEFSQVERLGQIVVRSGVEQLDDGVLALLGGKHQHWSSILSAAYAF